MEGDRLPLTPLGAQTIRAAIAELHNLQAAAAAKNQEIKRLTDLVQDAAGVDPAKFTIDGITEEKGCAYLLMRPIPAAPAKGGGEGQ